MKEIIIVMVHQLLAKILVQKSIGVPQQIRTGIFAHIVEKNYE
jgi:hypothetical protein